MYGSIDDIALLVIPYVCFCAAKRLWGQGLLNNQTEILKIETYKGTCGFIIS